VIDPDAVEYYYVPLVNNAYFRDTPTDQWLTVWRGLGRKPAYNHVLVVISIIKLDYSVMLMKVSKLLP
jgi:hypothetical protein